MWKWILLLALTSASFFSKVPTQSTNPLVGTRKLQSATITTDKGEVRNSWGATRLAFSPTRKTVG